MTQDQRALHRAHVQRLFGPDTLLFDDLALEDWFCFAGDEHGAVYQKKRKARYQHQGWLCYIQRTQPVKRRPAPQ